MAWLQQDFFFCIWDLFHFYSLNGGVRACLDGEIDHDRISNSSSFCLLFLSSPCCFVSFSLSFSPPLLLSSSSLRQRAPKPRPPPTQAQCRRSGCKNLSPGCTDLCPDCVGRGQREGRRAQAPKEKSKQRCRTLGCDHYANQEKQGYCNECDHFKQIYRGWASDSRPHPPQRGLACGLRRRRYPRVAQFIYLFIYFCHWPIQSPPMSHSTQLYPAESTWRLNDNQKDFNPRKQQSAWRGDRGLKSGQPES